jgi:2-isopropylmalate synthase
MYDAEHFFDGYRDNPAYAIKTIQVAEGAGAEVIILCDTNGGSMPTTVGQVVQAVQEVIRVPLGIHCHNDGELAVANSLAAVEAGVIQVQGTINGYGERCGNANLCSLLPLIQLKLGYRCVPPSRLSRLTEISRYVAEVCNMRPEDHQPFVGHSAFAHKGGVHIHAVLKNPRTYEHMDPALVGNRRRLLVSQMGGRSTVLAYARAMGLKLKNAKEEAKLFLKRVQEMEAEGYQFEAAEESFELLLERAYRRFKEFFKLEGFRVMVEKGMDGAVSSEATIRLKVGDASEHTAAGGKGPVHALDRALRKALVGFYPSLKNMRLVDFKVRDLESQAGTAAKVRVLVQSQDATDTWWTVGVSENIIEASWQALVDSVEYKLLKDLRHKRKR